MPNETIVVYHDGLDTHATIPASTLPIYQQRGWRVPDPESDQLTLDVQPDTFITTKESDAS